MAAWREIVEAAPDVAAHVQRCFGVRKHCTLATLRRDGSPRISGIEVDFGSGELWLGMMRDSVKALDLRRDPRLALHSPTEDPPEREPTGWIGEAKIAGQAVEAANPSSKGDGHRFSIEVAEVVLTTVADSGDHLLIRSWHPDRGLEVHRRF